MSVINMCVHAQFQHASIYNKIKSNKFTYLEMTQEILQLSLKIHRYGIHGINLLSYFYFENFNSI